jgi:hypothetical protein
MDGVYAENAGAFFGECVNVRDPGKRSTFSTAMNRGLAETA